MSPHHNNKNVLNPLNALAAALLAAGLVSPAFAQVAVPDAGRLNRELLEQPPAQPTPAPNLQLPAAAVEKVAPGGLTVLIKQIQFSGNTVYTNEQLGQVLAQALNKSYDLAGLYNLAEAVSAFYREQGYSFAKVFVPEQGYAEGVLTLQVLEGMYGNIVVSAQDDRHAQAAERFLSPLKSGEPIYSPELERQVLLLDDQPGYDVNPVVKPGATQGTGDLDVALQRTPLVSGNVSINNHGNRYTGYLQARANVFLNSLFQFGDQVSVTGLQSDEALTYGAVAYSLPLGSSGLRGTVGYSITDYELGREFANLQASGDAETVSVGVSYPFIRSRKVNLTGSLSVLDKTFFDEQRSVNSRVNRSSDATAVALNFDRTDDAGLSYGQLEWVQGDFNGPVPDVARTNGSFSRVNYDLVRLQSATRRVSVYGRLNGQWTGDNLDSSEGFALGGPYAVRAYPTGEATGDKGLLAQLELRFALSPTVSPFVFYDTGRITVEADAVTPGLNSRSLSGLGLGVRYQSGPIGLELLAARRQSGGNSQTDPRNNSVMTWLLLRYNF